MNETALTYLHLSDLHLGCRGRELWWQVEDDFAQSVRQGVERLGGAPDLVFLTGDLAFSGNAKEYRLVDVFLDDLRGYLREADPKADPIVIPVPGNHDVRRPKGEKAFRYVVLEKYGLGDDDANVRELRKLLWEKRKASLVAPLFKSYQDWRQRSILPRLEARGGVRVHVSHFPGDLAVEIDLPGRFPLLVVGLNSTWMQYKGGDFDGKLELPPSQLSALLDGGGKSSPLDALHRFRRRLLLIHQPESWLTPKAQGDFRTHVYPARRFDACLHGHLHKGISHSVAASGGAPRHYFQAASLFGLDHFGTAKEERIFGYAWGRITADGEIRVWPLGRVVRGDGTPAFDRDPTYTLEVDGSFVFRDADPDESAPVEAPDPELERYAYWAHERQRGLSLIGVGGGDVQMRLEEVYVPLRIARRRHIEVNLESGKVQRGWYFEHAEGDVELEQIFSQPAGSDAHLVIFGDPGAGKTTVLRKLHHQCLASGAASLGLEDGTLPVFFRLRRLGEEDLQSELQKLLGREIHELSEGKLDADLGRRLWERGRLLLLLDGLDEIADDKLRARVCEYLEWQLQGAALRGVRAVVSCRYTGYGGDVALSDAFLPLDIRPLDAAQCRSLVHLWFHEAQRALPNYAEAEVREAAARLVRALDGKELSSQRLKVLVGSPLLLTLLCVVVLRGGEMPKQRVAFYEQCLRVLLSQWSRSKRGADDAWEPPLDADTALAVLRTLAWELHRNERRDDLSKPELLLHLEERLEQLGRRESAFQVLRWLHREAGILAEYAPQQFGFLHLGVQEYLTALQVANAGEELLGELCDRCGDPWWQEVLLLTFGLPGGRLFTPLMKRLLASSALLERADLVRACVDEAPEAKLEPFLEWLAPERDEARQAAVLRLVRDRREPELKARVETLKTSDDGTVRALAVRIAEEMERTRMTEERCDVFVIHHDDDADDAAELRERLERRALRVRTLPSDGGSDVDEEVLAGTGQVAVVVGARRPWEEASLRSWIRLFQRRECEIIPVRLPGFRSTEVPTNMGFEPWLELDEDWNGIERLVGVAAAKTIEAPEVEGRAFTEPLTEARFLWIPGGRFQMGGEAYDDEKPVHWVRISPFWLAETPVTNHQYARFLEATGREEPPTWRDRRFSAPEQPVVTVSWIDAKAFCRWLSEKSGLEVGLPTEAQWEFAARGPESREYPWGDAKPDGSRACFGQDWQKGKPAPVGSFPDGAGPFEALDQAGNVWEWCQDAWDEEAYAKRGKAEPLDPVVDREGDEDVLRLLRGGSWDYPAELLRAACRSWYPAANRDQSIGFRLVCRSREP